MKKDVSSTTLPRRRPGPGVEGGLGQAAAGRARKAETRSGSPSRKRRLRVEEAEGPGTAGRHPRDLSGSDPL